MKHLLYFLIAFGIFINPEPSISQIKMQKYISADKLSEIVLRNNNTFGYILYDGFSPYSVFEKSTNKFCGTKGYIVKEIGAGHFDLKKNILSLNFETFQTQIDSIDIKLFESEESENIIVKIFPKMLDSQTIIPPGISVKSNDNKINITNNFGDFAELTLSKKQIPISLYINENYILNIIDKKNQNVELFFNSYKMMTNEKIANKLFDFSKMVLVKQ